MFHYITLGSNDLPRSKRFYDAVLAPLGIINTIFDDTDVAYAEPPNPGEKPFNMFWVLKPLLPVPATWGNGTQVVFAAKSRAAVDAFHANAMAHGGIDEGAPGLRRYSEHFYACFVRDPDGNKIAVVCEKPE